MNVSNLSTYDNVASCEVSEGIMLALEDLLNIIKTSDPISYCPFCIVSFADVLILEEHLKSVHLPFLHELLRRSINVDKCPFCPAKLFSTHLVAKHSLTYHSYVLFETFCVKRCNKIQCLFCSDFFDQSAIAEHINTIHNLDFNEWFVGKFCLKSAGIAGLVEIPAQHATVMSDSMEMEVLNNQFGGMKVLSQEKPKRSILKNQNQSCSSKSSHSKSKNKLPVCRQLRFEEDKENITTPRSLRPRRSPTNSSEKISSRSLRSGSINSWTTELKRCAFQCGKCSVCFSNSTQLVMHVKKEHRKLSLNLLQPFYQCALCGARFYKSSYLKKHSSMHSLTKFR